MRAALALCALLLLASAASASNIDAPGVTQALARYANDVNYLVSLSPSHGANASACAYPDAARQQAIAAAAAAVIGNNFSGRYGKYYTVQRSDGLVTNNMTVGAPGNLGASQVYVNTSEQWRAALVNFYIGFTGYFFSAPSHWLYSTPQVEFRFFDARFGNAATATVTVENESRGFICDSGVRKYQMIYNVFEHVFCYEPNLSGSSTTDGFSLDLGDWKICGFYERNKAFLKMDASLIDQQYP